MNGEMQEVSAEAAVLHQHDFGSPFLALPQAPGHQLPQPVSGNHEVVPAVRLAAGDAGEDLGVDPPPELVYRLLRLFLALKVGAERRAVFPLPLF